MYQFNPYDNFSLFAKNKESIPVRHGHLTKQLQTVQQNFHPKQKFI
jgi:hypothetical protein